MIGVWVSTSLYPHYEDKNNNASSTEKKYCDVWDYTYTETPWSIGMYNFIDSNLMSVVIDIFDLNGYCNRENIFSDFIPPSFKFDYLLLHFTATDAVAHIFTSKEMWMKIEQMDTFTRLAINLVDYEEEMIIRERLKLLKERELMLENNSTMKESDLAPLSPLRKGTGLMIFGDHGMTDSGGHAKGTLQETDAGMLFYSPRPFLSFTNLFNDKNNESILELLRPLCKSGNGENQFEWEK
jgi:predicted AlkP superfamily pyrophosphatase or phosphodiesterase